MNNVLLPRALLKFSWGYLRKHFWQSALMVVGIMLAVAVVIGVDMANESASQGFDLSTSAVTGKATHYLSAGSQGLDEQVYFDLKRQGIEAPAAPVITDYVSSPDLDGATQQLLGIDPFVEAPFREYLGVGEEIDIEELTSFLTQPNSVLISKEQADQYGLTLGSKIRIEYGGYEQTLTIVGLLSTNDTIQQRAINEILLVDLSTAQEITGKIWRLDRVDLILPEDSSAISRDLQELLPPGVTVQPVEARTGIIKEMTRAFRVNLTALSLLAMVVALFLIYNTMTFSVIQRRSLFGILRSLGVTQREIFLLVLLEAFGLGILGSLLGTGLGILMGRGTVGLVTQTINDLFYVTTVRDIPLPAISLIKGNMIGVVATVVTASFPALEAISVPPRTAVTRSDLESKARRIIPKVGWAGAVMILLGTASLLIPSDNLVLSFASTFAIIIGLAMLTPQITIGLMRIIARLTEKLWGVLGKMAPREVVSSISRTAVAVAALMIAVAVTIGVSLMISSFRMTVVTWLDQILHGDIYVSAPDASTSQLNLSLDPEVISTLEAWDGVERIDFLQTALVDSPFGPIQVSANNNPNDGLEQLYFSAQYPPEQILDAMKQDEILISEPLANRLDLPRENAQLALYTDRGLHSFPIAGIYYDYSSTQGNVILWMDTYQQYWDDRAITGAALILEEGEDPDAVSRELQTALSSIQELRIRPNKALRAETMEIFDRTFAITSALQLMTTIVAFVGVLSAMMSLQLDKQRQLGILRAIGLTGRQLWRLVLLETGLMGAVAGLFAMPTGYILSLILIYIINRRSFGWTLLMQVEFEPFFQAFAIAVGASLLAGLYPAWRILQRNPSEAIRYE